jgi:HK97 family phage portal protein
VGIALRAAQSLVDATWRAVRLPSRVKAVPPGGLSTVDRTRGWLSLLVRESYPGAWQQNVTVSVDTALSYSAVYRCISLIASDIAKLRVYLAEVDSHGIWSETTSPAFSPVLRKPNAWQNRIQFFSSWMLSKLIEGNTYVLKERDQRSVVTGLYVLDPGLVNVLVAPDGSIFYELQTDALSGIRGSTQTVPASEVIHDRCVSTFNHPLIGIPPLRAAGAAALQGLQIQNSSTKFFATGQRPSGILTAPTAVNEEDARQILESWEQKFGPGKSGGVAVLGNDMKYEPMGMTAEDSQLLEQLKWSAETVASVFGVPAYKIGVGNLPSYENVEALDQQYYSQCLQIHIEQIELCLDEGLGLAGSNMGTVFDLDGLLRMDTASKVRASSEAIKAGFMAPNEARLKFDLAPVAGGDTPYMQQQEFSLAALDARDRANPAPSSTSPSGGGGGGRAPAQQPTAELPPSQTTAAAKALPSGEDADVRAARVAAFGARISRSADRYTRRSA